MHASARDKIAAYRVERVSFSYGRVSADGARDRSPWALRELSCAIQEGEVFGIIGPNGSGKSSLLKLLSRVLEPQTGRIELFGRDLHAEPQDAVARAVAFVPQDAQLVFPFTIAETVLMGRFAHRQPRWTLGGLGWETPEDLQVADAAMVDMDIAHLADRAITAVSSGERQRALVARALTQQPRVLLLDEPTAFLDLHHQVDICNTLRRLNEERGLTVVLVSHDLNLASQYCDRLMLLQAGRVYRIGTPEEIVRRETLEAVYGCAVLIDPHPMSGLPRVTLPGRPGAPR